MLHYTCQQCSGTRFWIDGNSDHHCQACRPLGDREAVLADYDTSDPSAAATCWRAAAQKVAEVVCGLSVSTVNFMETIPPTTPREFCEILERLEAMIAQLRSTVDTVREAAIQAQRDAAEMN